MLWWNRTLIAPTRVTVTPALPRTLESDPAFLADAHQADEVRGFVDVRVLGADCVVRVYRYGGPAEGALEPLDASFYEEISSEGITMFDWPVPPPPCIATKLLIVRTTPGTSVSEVSLLQTCRFD